MSLSIPRAPAILLAVDLEPLKIDRSKSSPRKQRRGGFPWGKLAFVVLLAAALWVFQRPLIATYERLTLPEVETAKVVRRSPSSSGAVRGAAANGYVVARKRAALSADTPGRIIELNVEEGAVVKEGELVARLYDAEYKAAVQRAIADFELSQAALKKSEAEREAAASDLERLKSRKAVTVANLEEAKALALLANRNYDRYVKLVAEGIERQQRLDEAEEDRDSKAARVVSVEAEVGAAEAAVRQSERRVDTAEAAVQEAAARVEVMAATRDQAQATLDKTEVRAPFSGVVVLKDAEVGEVVSPNSQGGNSRGSVVTMVDFESLEVQADVPETSLSAVRIGAPAKIFLDAFPEDAYEGVVERIWPTADRSKATVEVRVGFERLDERLRPEMGVRVVFVEESEDEPAEGEEDDVVLLQIPADCLTRIDGKDHVFVLERDVVRRRAVSVRPGRSGRVSVDTGLRVGETVVVSPAPELKDGQRVLVAKGS